MNDVIRLVDYNPETGKYEQNATVSARRVGKGVDEETLLAVLEAFLNNYASPFYRGKQVGSMAATTGLHRTIQGSLVNFALGILDGFAESTDLRYTDPRNQTAAESAHRVKELLDTGEIHQQPFI